MHEIAAHSSRDTKNPSLPSSQGTLLSEVAVAWMRPEAEILPATQIVFAVGRARFVDEPPEPNLANYLTALESDRRSGLSTKGKIYWVSDYETSAPKIGTYELLTNTLDHEIRFVMQNGLGLIEEKVARGYAEARILHMLGRLDLLEESFHARKIQLQCRNFTPFPEANPIERKLIAYLGSALALDIAGLPAPPEMIRSVDPIFGQAVRAVAARRIPPSSRTPSTAASDIAPEKPRTPDIGIAASGENDALPRRRTAARRRTSSEKTAAALSSPAATAKAEPINRPLPTLHEITKRVTESWKVHPDVLSLAPRSFTAFEAQGAVSHICRNCLKTPAAQIAQILNRDLASLAELDQRFERVLKSIPHVQDRITAILKAAGLDKVPAQP